MPEPRSTRIATALLAAALSAAASAPHPAAAAGSPPDLAALFPLQAPVHAAPGCLARLELPTEVLAECAPDLSDLRLFDRAGGEVAYAIDGRGAGERVEVLRRIEPALLAASRERIEREDRLPLWRERYEIEIPPPPPEGAWRLALGTGRTGFTAAVTIAGAAPDEADSPLLAAGSVFRLADPQRERLDVELPAGTGGRAAVVIESVDGPWIEPSLALEHVRSLGGGGEATVALEEAARRSGDGRTEIELVRPGAVVPDVLLVATRTPSFRRRVEVWDEGPGAHGAPLGSALLLSVPGAPAIRSLRVPLAPARGDRLRVVIDDGDSPPLDRMTFTAALGRPALIFALASEEPPEGASAADPCAGATPPAEPGATLRFGGGRADSPRYDLAALVPAAGRLLAGRDAAAGERLLDLDRLAPARLGTIGRSPAYDPQPALAFAMRPGAAAEPTRFRWRRPVTAAPSAEGLNRLRLAPEDLARARADLADLRLVDTEGRQRPYLLEPGSSSARLPLAVEACRAEAGRSCYRLTPPAAPLAASALALDPDAAFFDRPFVLEGLLGDERVRIAAGRLTRGAGDPRPVEIPLPAGRRDAWLLTVDDGDDAPLELRSAAVRVPLPALYFAAPTGGYALLLGDPDAEPARYELERVRGVVLAVAAGDAGTGEIEENPAFSRASRLAGRSTTVLLWVAVALAVAVLIALTLRLARSEGG
jgi:hypothetical protein